MSAYVISEVEVLDETDAERYRDLAAASVARHGDARDAATSEPLTIGCAPTLALALHRLAEHVDLPDGNARRTIQRIEAALRSALALQARPDQVTAPGIPATLADEFGLTPAQMDELRVFAEWLRHRDAR